MYERCVATSVYIWGPPRAFMEQGNLIIYFLGNKGYSGINFSEQGIYLQI